MRKNVLCTCGTKAWWDKKTRLFRCVNCTSQYHRNGNLVRKGDKMERTKSIMSLKKEIAGLKEQLDAQNTKDGRMKEALSFPKLSESLWSLLNDQGFRTGSTVYAPGIEAADEDWCIACSPGAFRGFAANTNDPGYFETDGFASLYAHDGKGKMINILCFSDYALYEAWYATTQAMDELRGSSISEYNCDPTRIATKRSSVFGKAMEKKWCRTRLFQALRDISWPVKALQQDLPDHEARSMRKCKRCGRKADFFSSWPEKKLYRETLICERCREEKVQSPSF